MDDTRRTQLGEWATVGACCRALFATPARLIRPRPPDHLLLSSLADAGRPPISERVTVTALHHTDYRAPRVLVTEGVWRPPTVRIGMVTFLVRHPKARLLVDPALCADVHRLVLRDMPTALRMVVGSGRPVTGLAEALAGHGLSPTDIDMALPTHLHWDHVSGLLELPDELPVITTAVERDFALAPRTPLGVVAGPLESRSFEFVELDDRPVLTFPHSHDLFGDGSVVLVDLAGHTPGSVGVLLALTDGRSVLLAGDSVWHRSQIELLREKAPMPGQLVDHDRDRAFATLHRLHAVPDGVTVVPSHDHAAVRALG